MMNFIDDFSKKFRCTIIHLSEFKHGLNSYITNDSGEIIGLYLYEINLLNVESILSLCESLIDLKLEDCNIKDLSSIHKFSNLRKLDLSFNPITSDILEKIKPLGNLKELRLSYTDIEDTSCLSQLTSLEELYLNDCNNIFNIKGLSSMPNLLKLNIDSTLIESFKDIEPSHSVKYLSYRDNCLNRISDLEIFPMLEELIITGQNISKIEGVENVQYLKKLRLSTTRISKIEGLDKLSDLEILDLNHNGIKNIVGLDHLTKLRKLNLSENYIKKVENLDHLINLEYLLVDRNEVEEFDLRFLDNLKSDCFISLVGNPISEIKGKIPKTITFRFENDHWVPKSII